MLKWLLVVAVGVFVIAVSGPRLSRFGLGRLPGDLTLRWKGRRIYVPLTTTLLLSLALTLLVRLI